jgi:hypothetical protein
MMLVTTAWLFESFSVVPPLQAQAHDRVPLGSMLRVGSVLVYSSGGVETPWTIDSLAADTMLGGRTRCVRLRLRLDPNAAQTTRAFCADSSTLLTWDDRSSLHRPTRPIVANGRLEIRSASGASSLFETTMFEVDTISGSALAVVPTTVTYRDSTGRAVRRLRERFSLDLLTATSGVFEVADATQAGGWRVERRFDLVAITSPPIIDVRVASTKFTSGFTGMPSVGDSTVPRTLYLAPATIVSDEDVLKVRTGPATDGLVLEIVLSSEAAARLRQTTATNIGQYLAVLANGRLAAAAIIMASIPTGSRVSIGLILPPDAAVTMRALVLARWPEQAP